MSVLKLKNTATGIWEDIQTIIGPRGLKGDKGDPGAPPTEEEIRAVFQEDLDSLEDEISEKMSRYVMRLVKNADNTYKLTSLDDVDLSFTEVRDITQDLSKYVVVLYGNSKLRPQYVSTNEMIFIGLDRSTESKILRMHYTPDRLAYDAYVLAEKSDLAAKADKNEVEAVQAELEQLNEDLTLQKERIDGLENSGVDLVAREKANELDESKLSKLHYELSVDKSDSRLKSGSLQVFYFAISAAVNGISYMRKYPLKAGEQIEIKMPEMDGVSSWRYRVGFYKNDNESAVYDSTAYQIAFQDSNVIVQRDGFSWVAWCAYAYDSGGNPVAFNAYAALAEPIIVTLPEKKETYIDSVDALNLIRDYSGLKVVDILKEQFLVSSPYVTDNGSMGNPANAVAVRLAKIEPITMARARLFYPVELAYAKFSVAVYNPDKIGASSEAPINPPLKYLISESRRDANYVDIDFSGYIGYGFSACIYAFNADDTAITLRSRNGLQFYVCNIPNIFEMPQAENKYAVQTKNATLTLLHFSDIHSDKNALARIMNSVKGYTYDDAICTGDLVANDSTQGGISSWWNSKVMTCIGNHDSAVYNASSGYNWTALSMAERDGRYISPFKANWGITHTSGKSYYYKDYSTQKIRMIVLDAMLYSATANASEAAEQNAWLTNLLTDAISKAYHVIIAEHAPHGGSVSVKCNFSRYDAPQTMPTYSDCNLPDSVINIVANAIANGLTFIGYLCGHTHQDNIWDCKGDGTQLMYCVTCAITSEKPQWITSDQYRGEHGGFVDAFNLVSIDTSAKMIKLVRFGADCDKYMRSRKAICIDYAHGKVIGES